MIWKVFIVVTALAAFAAGQIEGETNKKSRAGELIDLLQKTLNNDDEVTHGKKGGDLIQTLKDEFPDLSFTEGESRYPSIKSDGDPTYSSPEKGDSGETFVNLRDDLYSRPNPQHWKVSEEEQEKEDEEPAPESPIKKEIFTIMDTIFSIMKYQGLITDNEEPVGNLINSGFALLSDYIKRKALKSKYGDTECPYSYDTAGELCLSFDINAQNLNWNEARLYCQIVKGGDLAIFKDANQYDDMIKYVRRYDPERKHAYWIGASDPDYTGHWKFINGEDVPQGTPYWGVKVPGDNQNPSKQAHYNYGFLDNTDHFYLGDISYEASTDESHKTVPLCQYYPGRGHNSHQGYHAESYYHEDANKMAMQFAHILGAASDSYQFDTPHL